MTQTSAMMDASWIGLIFMFLVFGMALLGFAFWVWMIVDCALHETEQNQQKLIWILVILLANLLGALIYFFVRKLPRRSAPPGS